MNESHSSLPVLSSKDMAFSAGTAEGQQFVFEKGQTTMTSQLAMASSSLLVKQKNAGSGQVVKDSTGTGAGCTCNAVFWEFVRMFL